MGHKSAVSAHPISASFSQVDNWSTDPRVLGCHMKSPISSSRVVNLVIVFCFFKVKELFPKFFIFKFFLLFFASPYRDSLILSHFFFKKIYYSLKSCTEILLILHHFSTQSTEFGNSVKSSLFYRFLLIQSMISYLVSVSTR